MGGTASPVAVTEDLMAKETTQIKILVNSPPKSKNKCHPRCLCSTSCLEKIALAPLPRRGSDTALRPCPPPAFLNDSSSRTFIFFTAKIVAIKKPAERTMDRKNRARDSTDDPK